MVVTFGLKHPYDLPQSDFPVYLNRKDIHVFDVQSIVFMNPPDGMETTRIREFPATRSDIVGMGSSMDYVDYTLNIGPRETFSFLMVISASYGQSAKGQGTELGQRLWARLLKRH